MNRYNSLIKSNSFIIYKQFNKNYDKILILVLNDNRHEHSFLFYNFKSITVILLNEFIVYNIFFMILRILVLAKNRKQNDFRTVLCGIFKPVHPDDWMPIEWMSTGSEFISFIIRSVYARRYF